MRGSRRRPPWLRRGRTRAFMSLPRASRVHGVSARWRVAFGVGAASMRHAVCNFAQPSRPRVAAPQRRCSIYFRTSGSLHTLCTTQARSDQDVGARRRDRTARSGSIRTEKAPDRPGRLPRKRRRRGGRRVAGGAGRAARRKQRRTSRPLARSSSAPGARAPGLSARQSRRTVRSGAPSSGAAPGWPVRSISSKLVVPIPLVWPRASGPRAGPRNRLALSCPEPV
jgi:hypothetical protein